MDPAAPVGVTVTAPPRLRAAMAAGALLLVLGAPAMAAERYALVVSGASGGAPYAQKYDTWRGQLVTTLREKFKYPDDRLFVLAETESRGVRKATRENVQRVLGDLQKRLTKDDLLLVFLIGHGTSLDVDEAKFNLVGPDLAAGEWAALLKPIPGRIVFVDTTAASFAFMSKIAGRGRVVLTATDSAAQQFETVLAEFLVKAFEDPAAADLDKDGRVSLLEAFTYASAGVRKWYEDRGELPTERSLLDDNGDGIGREADNPGPDGPLARITYLEPEATPADAAQAVLLTRRAEIEADIEAIKARRPSMPPEQYDAQIEKLLLELARVSQQIRPKS